MASKTLKDLGVEIRAPNPNLPLLIWSNQARMCNTHMRPQEHYESPNADFRNRAFTREEFQTWYINNSPKGKELGIYTYDLDWNGFNVPGRIFKPFFEGSFNPLTPEEEALISFARSLPESFYLIATHRNHPSAARVVRHELGHAYWELDEEYRGRAMTILEKYSLKPLFEHLRENGYDGSVLLDESHAQAIHTRPSARYLIPDQLHKRMSRLLEETVGKEKIEQYTRGLSDEETRG